LFFGRVGRLSEQSSYKAWCHDEGHAKDLKEVMRGRIAQEFLTPGSPLNDVGPSESEGVRVFGMCLLGDNCSRPTSNRLGISSECFVGPRWQKAYVEY